MPQACTAHPKRLLVPVGRQVTGLQCVRLLSAWLATAADSYAKACTEKSG